jgi:hypothetical protein
MRTVATWALAIGLYAAPPSEPTPEPGSLPSYDEAPIAPDVSFDGVPLELDAEDPPPTGRGRTAVGAILLTGGVVLTSVSTAFIIQETDVPAWIPGAVLGGTAVVLGAIFVATGDIRHRAHRDWAKTTIDAPVPPRGDGLLAGGLTCMIAGTMGTIIGGVSLTAFQAEGDPPYGQVMVPLGLVSIVTGVGLLAAGGVRRKHYDRWDAGRIAPSLSLLPGHRQQIGGLSFGLAGRF